MLDSTPHKTKPPAGQNEMMHALSAAHHAPAGKSDSRARLLDLIALWNDAPPALREHVERETDWGPFELAEMTPAYYDAYGARRVLCRFVFHGEAKDRFHFEAILFERLNAITSWKFAPRFEFNDTD